MNPFSLVGKINPFTDIDYGNAWNKYVGGDSGADVLKSYDNVGKTAVGGTNDNLGYLSGTDAYAPGGSKYASARTTANDEQVSNSYIDGGEVQTAAQRAASAADERAYYDDTISQLDRLLGGIGYQTQAGLENLQRSAGNERTKLGNQKTQTLQGYDDQNLSNAQEKQKGIEQVDSYANQNYNSLQRLLAGANAGSSSVARELVPYLVSKAAGTRRTNVFDTAGKNEQQIVTARKNAEDQYETAFGELDDQGRAQEQSFRQSILNQENDLLAKKQEAQMKREMANGSGYQAARSAAQGTQGAISQRQNQLNSLFSQFKPTFQQKALSFQKPELGQYTVDRAAVQAQGQGLPTESSYYQSMLKKKQEGIL